MKKMLKLVAVFIFVCYFAIISSSNYYAITIEELQATATNLTYGKSVADAIEYEGDVNWYKFTVSDTGYFQLSLSFTNNSNVDDIGFGWNIKIYSATDLANEIREFSSVESNLTTAKMSLPKGDYYVSVEDQHSSFPTKGCEYAIKAIFGVDSHWEKEPNNENKDATVINVNEEYKAVHINTEDIDWYKFTTNKDGKISVSFSIGAETDIDNIGWGWHFEIYDSNFVLLKKYSSIERNFTTVELPFSKGTYYVKVEMQHSSFPCTDCVYGIKVNYNTPARWESEYNDTNVQADVIKVNEVWNGTSYHEADVDWYKVKTTKAGYFQVELGVPSTVNKDAVSWGWHMTVYDKNLNEIKVISNIKSTTKTVLLPYGKEIFYIKIETQHSGFAPLDCHYTIKVINKAASNFESENNDTKAKADKITIGKTYNGVTQIVEDEDWYKFTISKAGTVKIDLKKHSSASKEDISWGWSFIIYNKNNDELIKVSNIQSTGTATLDLKKGTYYVLVEAQHTSFAPDECRYTISTKYSQTPAASKITSISSKSKKVTLKWKKSSKATGYYVYRSTEKDGEYKKIATVKGASKTSYKDSKGLKKGRTYYYRIVAYKTTDKVIAKAKAGNTKSVKVK